MDHYMEPLSSQAIVDEDNQDAIVNANVDELESQCDNNEPPLTATPARANNDDNIPQPPAPKKAKEKPDIDWHSWWKTSCIITEMKAPVCHR